MLKNDAKIYPEGPKRYRGGLQGTKKMILCNWLGPFWAQMGPKWTRGALGGSLGRPGGPRGGTGGPLEALGSPREAPRGLWGLKKIIENPLCFIVFLHYGGFRGSLGRPKGAQRDLSGGRGGPRGAQGRPKGGQGGSKGRLWRRPKTVRKTEAAVTVRMGPFWEVRRLRGTRRRGKGRINLPWIWVLEPELSE